MSGKEFQHVAESDFSKEANRRSMADAIEKVRAQLGRHYPLFIGGREVDTAEKLRSINPANFAEVVGTVGKADIAEADQAIQAARKAYREWSKLPAEKRAEYFFRAADILERDRYEHAAWQVFEVGKIWREADADVCESIDYLRYYGHEMIRLGQPRVTEPLPGEINEYLYSSRGVAVVIAPWNFPLAILLGMTTAAAVTGNCAIMKPSGQSVIVAAKFMEVLREAGLPAGVINFLPGPGGKIGRHLVTHPMVSLIAFTGSREVGLWINQAASETPPEQPGIKRVIAELGGKNAVIIDDSADLDEAVAGTVASAFGFCGQKCSACSRAIVLENQYDLFLERLVEATKSLKIGMPTDPGTQFGPVVDKSAMESILGYIDKGKNEAREALNVETEDFRKKGYFVGPVIFADVSPSATIAQEEIFGPILSVIKVKNFDEALEVANGTSYALTGGLYSRSPANIERVKSEMEVGNLYINRKITGAIVQRQPFGGFKMSGIGSKAGGPDYLVQFMIPRTRTENILRHGFAPVQAAEE